MLCTSSFPRYPVKMPRVARRRRLKLTEREIYLNQKEVVVVGRKLGAVSIKLIECSHRDREEIDIPSYTCIDCAWEGYSTDEA